MSTTRERSPRTRNAIEIVNRLEAGKGADNGMAEEDQRDDAA